jgi:hypothetical protein
VASYDSPGFVDKIPGGTVTESTGAPGSSVSSTDTDSTTPAQEAGTIGNSAMVSPYASSLVNATRVEVDPVDVLLTGQADVYDDHPDRLTGVTGIGTTGAGLGSASHNPHPNSTARP